MRETGQKYFCYFSERLHVEGSVYAQQLLEQGKIGKVVQVMGWGPHRTGPIRVVIVARAAVHDAGILGTGEEDDLLDLVAADIREEIGRAHV